MNIQIYSSKKNFDVQKAERFFKERNIKFQSVDLKKHKIGKKELELFIRAAGGLEQLIDRKDKNTNRHRVALVFTEQLMMDAILEDASCLLSPIVRNGSQITIGADEKVWQNWLKEA